MGTGGIGKTTISRAIAHSQRICAYFQSNRYFVACDTVLTVQTLVQELLVTFRVPSNSQDPLADLLQSLGSMGPCLLILDNFETPWDNAEQKNGLTTLLGHLHSLTNLTLIVTMRGKVRPDGVSWSTLSLTSLPPLDVNAACNAFTAVAGINHFDEDELRTLMEILDCVPLAITLMAKQAEVRGNISDLISQWNVDRTSMLVADQVGDRLLNVEYSIQLSVESSRMKQCPEAFTLLQIISMLPNGLHKVHLNTLAAGSLGRMTTRAAHVIQEVELAYQDRERLKVLSPIRAYVQSRHPLDREKALEIKRFYWDLVGKYSEDVSETGDITMIEPDLLHAEMGNLSYLLTTALSEEDVDEDVVQATYDLTMLFYWTTPSNELLQILLDKPELSCDPLLKAKCFQLHSDIASRTGHLHQAVASVASAQDLFEAMGNHLGVAQCLQSLGDMAKVQNNHKTATNYFSSAMELFRLEDGQLGYTQSLLSLAQMECIAGNYDNANKLFQEALSHFRGLEDKVGSAQCLIGLGEVAQAQDHYPIALERYTLAREQFLLIGHAAGANQCLQSLAGTAAMQSRFGRAISQFLQAKNQFHKVGDILGEMQCIQALGDIARLQGRGSDAREFLRTSRLFFARFGDNMASSQCIQALGDVAIDEGDYALGRDFLRKAMAFYDTINRRLERAQCRMSLGRAARKEGELEQPEKYLSLSLAEFRDIKERRGAADCVRQFGLLHWAKGDYTKALTDFKYALSEYEEMGNDLGIAECQEHMGIFLEGTDAKESRAMLQEALLGFEKTGMQKKYERCQVRLRSLQERPMPGEFNINSGQEGVETERVKGTNFTSVTLLPLVVVVACSLVF